MEDIQYNSEEEKKPKVTKLEQDFNTEGKFLKIPPQNKLAEIAVLGGMLTGRNAIVKVIPIIKSKDAFYDPRNAVIFDVMVKLFHESKPVDILTLSDELDRLEKLDAAGGMKYLTELNTQIPTSANIENHAQIIQEKYLSRELITIGTKVVETAFEDRLDSITQISNAESEMFRLAEMKVGKAYQEISSLVKEAFSRIEANRQREGDKYLTGVTSGLPRLDAVLNGFQPADLIILAARPSMGKTALALNFARYAATLANKNVAIFSLEMSEMQLVDRMLSAESGIELGKLRVGALNESDMRNLYKGVQKLKESNIFIDDSSMLSVVELRAKCRRLKTEHNLDLVVIDYLQLLRAPNAESREREISIISATLKQIAKELKIPVIALAQLNRGVEGRTDKRPMLSDLRESGSIEQDADVVMFIHRDDYYKYKKDGAEKGEDFQGQAANNIGENDAWILIKKHRNGRTDDVKVAFEKEIGRFSNYDDNEIPPEIRKQREYRNNENATAGF